MTSNEGAPTWASWAGPVALLAAAGAAGLVGDVHHGPRGGQQGAIRLRRAGGGRRPPRRTGSGEDNAAGRPGLGVHPRPPAVHSSQRACTMKATWDRKTTAGLVLHVLI